MDHGAQERFNPCADRAGHLPLGLFDERNLFEFSVPDYPGERLVACRNASLAKRRAHKLEALLCATEKSLEKIKARVAAATRLTGKNVIGMFVGKTIDQSKVAKHFELTIDGRRSHSSASRTASPPKPCWTASRSFVRRSRRHK